MAKKTKSLDKSEERLTEVVRTSAQQIWQAGLGAFTDLQQRTRHLAGDKVTHVRETVNTLEQVFEDRVTRALESIGVPMRKDVDALIAQVEDLSRQVAELRAAQAPQPKVAKKTTKEATSAKAKPARTSAVKTAKTAAKAPVKKVAAKKASARKVA